MSKFKFETKAKEFELNKSIMLERMGNNAVNHFKVTNFDAQGFVDSTVSKWKPRKNDSDPGRRLNVKTGRLRQSIRIVKKSKDSVTVGSEVPYAGFVNEQRPFIGKSKILDQKNKAVMDIFVKKAL